MKKVLLSSLTAVLLVGNGLYADESKVSELKTKTQLVSTNAINHARENANAKKADIKVIKEAVGVVALTKQAVSELNQNKKDDAIKTLKEASKKINILINRDKMPKLIPLDASVVVNQFAGTAYNAQNAVITSIALLKKNRVQDARHIIQNLKDEVDFITVNIPLVSYPSALKLASNYLKDGNVSQAKSVLITALNSFVEFDTITPLGIVEAQELIEAASKVAKTDKKLAISHLDAAKEALKKAKALGYTSSSDTSYKMLNSAINDVETEIRGKNKAEKLFSDLKNMIKEFKERAIKIFHK